MENININLLNINNLAIIYTRCSTFRQNNSNSSSLEMQQFACHDYCNDNNFEVIEPNVEEICSASVQNKQKKLELLINNNKNINLVIFDISRFCRCIFTGIKLIEKCINNNITLHFIKENLIIKNKKNLKNFTSGLINAQSESDAISYRVTESIKYRRSIGNYIGNPKYGYKIQTINGIKKLIFNNFEQHIIKIILKLKYGGSISDLDILTKELNNSKFTIIDRTKPIMYGNYDNSDIAFILNNNNIYYKNNKEWKNSNISNIIKNNNNIQDNIEKILDNVFSSFEKLLKINNTKKLLNNKDKICNSIIIDCNNINGSPIKSKINNILDISTLDEITNFLNKNIINYRVWTNEDIENYISNE